MKSNYLTNEEANEESKQIPLYYGFLIDLLLEDEFLNDDKKEKFSVILEGIDLLNNILNSLEKEEIENGNTK